MKIEQFQEDLRHLITKALAYLDEDTIADELWEWHTKLCMKRPKPKPFKKHMKDESL